MKEMVTLNKTDIRKNKIEVLYEDCELNSVAVTV